MDQRPVWQDFAPVGLKIYLPLRLGLSAYVALIIGLLPGLALPLSAELMARWGIAVPTGRLAELFFTPWLRYDALWYMKTALDGYELSELSTVVQGVHPLSNGTDLAFILFGLAMTIWAIRTLQSPYWLFMVLNVPVVISKSIGGYPLLGMPRFVLSLFPLYILLARASQTSAKANRLIVYSSLALLLFFSAQFALGGWAA